MRTRTGRCSTSVPRVTALPIPVKPVERGRAESQAENDAYNALSGRVAFLAYPGAYHAKRQNEDSSLATTHEADHPR